MALLSGSRLGPYEIVATLGAGGMGEVYRARDARIGRDVAIKILPGAFLDNVERLNRFQREAHAAGLLNHPNILAVYDVGTENCLPYMVSELLEGETLRARLRNGPIPVRKALEFAYQIADGLAAAHEKGITHRDLKPENLFVTKHGRIKILDFGLAKLTEKPPLEEENSALQTVAAESHPGIVLGTVGYMSPEQVRGLVVDHRSDIFSFGTILYEMVTGKRAFSGNTPADTMSAILQKEPPDLLSSTPDLPPAAEKIVRHCLEKDAGLRFQSTRDVAFAIETLSGVTESTASKTAIQGAQSMITLKKKTFLILILGLCAIVAVVSALIAGRNRIQEKPLEVLQLSILPPANTILTGRPILSPDSKRIVFEATDSSGKKFLWLRSLDSTDSQKLNGTEGATYPFWSPDSKWIAFFASSKLMKIQLPDGSPQVICGATDPRGGTWNQEGTILFAPYPDKGLYTVSAKGGDPIPATQLDKTNGEATHRFPAFLPDGRNFIFYSFGSSSKPEGIYLSSLRSNKKKYVALGRAGLFLPPSIFLFQNNEGQLYEQTFEVKENRLIGEARPLIDQLVGDYAIGGSFGFSATNNTIACVRGDLNSQLTWYDRFGKKLVSLGDPASYNDLALSMDGKRIVASIAGSQADDLWIIDSSIGNSSRLTFGPASSLQGVWSADNTKILYSTVRNGPYSIFMKDAGGGGGEQLLVRTENWIFPDSWSKDGRYILFQESNPKTNYDLWVLPVSQNGKAFPLLNAPYMENHGMFSPDGKYFAYSSEETGRSEIFVQTFPDVSQGKWQISATGGSWPLWSNDGKELFYVTLDKKMMAVDTSSGFQSTKAQVLFSNFPRRVRPTDGYSYAVSPDAQRFLMITPVEDPSRASITIISNWQQLLKK